MKILHVLYSGLGGHGSVFFSMVTADGSHEFEYEALFNGIEDLRAEYKTKCKNLGIEWSFIKKKTGIDLTYYKNLLRIIKNSNAEIIFLHNSAYIIPAKLAAFFSKLKKKIIIRETQANNLKGKRDWLWLSMAFLLASKIVFLSEEYRNEVQKKLHWLYSKNKVVVIPNGIDLAIFYPVINMNKLQITIGMQGRLTENKDHTTFLHAFALLKNQGYNNIKLKIAGDGTRKSELILLAKKLNIENEVEFTGILEENNLVQFLHNLTIYIHASHGETMSTAIMQAMACGLPIIASDVPGINNMIINNKTGILVPVKDIKSMVDGILKYINNKNFRETMAINGFGYAKENFPAGKMLESYKKLIL